MRLSPLLNLFSRFFIKKRLACVKSHYLALLLRQNQTLNLYYKVINFYCSIVLFLTPRARLSHLVEQIDIKEYNIDLQIFLQIPLFTFSGFVHIIFSIFITTYHTISYICASYIMVLQKVLVEGALI